MISINETICIRALRTMILPEGAGGCFQGYVPTVTLKFGRATSDYQTLALESPRQDSSGGLENKEGVSLGRRAKLTVMFTLGFAG